MQSVKDGDGKEVSLAQYAGKVTVVVNVASQCGYTEANYKGLTKLYRKFRDQGLVVCAPLCCHANSHPTEGAPHEFHSRSGPCFGSACTYA